MSVTATERLLLAALEQSATAGSGQESSPRPRSLSELTGAVGGPEQRLSRRIEIAAAIDDLRDRGLVEQRTREDGETVVELTPEGTECVATVREELAATTIEFVDDEHGRRQLTIGEVARVVDRSPVAIAAECSPDRVYHDRETVEDTENIFFGRQEQLTECNGHLEAVQHDRTGQAILLSGPSGIGKTTLAAELLASARQQDLSVRRARCRGSDAGPYHPLRAAVPAEDVPASLTAHAEYGQSPGDDLDPDTYEKARAALFYDLTEALVPADNQPPRVVFLDDLHLADPATLAYLEYLLAELHEAPIVFLGAYRPTELPANAPVGPGADTDGLPVTTVDLGQLERDPTQRLVEAVVGRPGAPEALVEAIHERTGGNPLFVEATVEALLETDQLDPHFQWYPDTPDAIDLPDEVKTTLAEHLGTFEASTRAVLTWAALAGEAAPVSVLQTVTALGTRPLDTRLEVLVETGVLEWTDDDRRAVAFRNEVVPEALTDRLTTRQRQTRHEAIARSFEELVDDTSAGSDEPDSDCEAAVSRGRSHALVIARQYEQACCHEQAIEWYRRSAEHAQDVYATETAIEAAKAALSLSKDYGKPESLLAVGQQLAEGYITTGQYEQARRYVRFLRERTPEDDTGRRQALAHLAARIASNRGEYDTALAEIENGLALEDGPTERRCQLLATTVDAERKRGNYERAQETIAKLRRVAERSGADQFEHRADQMLGSVAENQGNYERAREHLERALAGFEAVGDRHSIAEVHRNLGAVATRQGDYERAREHYRQALTTFEAVEDRHSTATVHLNLGVVARNQGTYEAAREHYRQARDGYEAVEDRHSIAKTHTNLGVVTEKQGEYETAREHYWQALEGFEAVEDHHRIALVHANLGAVAMHQGEYERAREHYQQALATFEAVEDRHSIAKVHANLGIIVQRQGEYEAAREHYQPALETFEAIEDRHSIARTHMNLGTVAARQGEYEQAREHLQQALPGLEAVEDRNDIARTQMNLGNVARHRGEYEQAREHYRQALEGFEAVDDTDWIARSRAGLGLVAHQRGDRTRTERAFEKAKGMLENVSADSCRAKVQLELARLAMVLDEPNRATSLARKASEAFQARQEIHSVARSRLVFGRARAATGDYERSHEHCQQALATFEAVSAPQDQLETLQLLVECCRETGDSEQAATYCQQAQSVLETAPAVTADQHREWVQRETMALEAG